MQKYKLPIMLTSFFSKSNPVNFLILGVLLVISFVAYHILSLKTEIDTGNILKLIAISALLIFTTLLLDFIVRKNNLTRKSTLAIFIFTFFVLMVPSIFGNTSILIAQICCLFSLRRVFSFASEKNIEKKILDASLWLLLASFFYFYSLLFFAVVYYAILGRPKTSVRYLFIPVLTALAILSITTSYFLLTENSFDWFLNMITPVSWDFTAYSSLRLLIPTTLFVSAIIWIGFYRLYKVSSIMRKEKPNFLVLLVILVTALVISLTAQVKDGSELYFLIAPLAITAEDYLENQEEKHISEIFLWILVVLPGVLVFL
jgi:hypothetical protein